MSLVWLVPLLPLLGFVLNGALALKRPQAKRAVSLIGPGVLLAAFGVAIAVVRDLAAVHPAAPVVFSYWDWIPVGALHITAALQVDPLSAVMILIVTGVGSLIHIFSVGYMRSDDGYARFFAYLNLFVFFMLVLVLGGSFPDVRRVGRRRPLLEPPDRVLVRRDRQRGRSEEHTSELQSPV